MDLVQADPDYSALRVQTYMHYFSWTEAEARGLSSIKGIVLLVTEVDQDGRVLRELGLDKDSKIVHRAPTAQNPWGLFDGQRIDVSNLTDEITSEVFERLWRG